MRTVATLLFPEFELLDVFGPLEMFGLLPDQFQLTMIAQHGVCRQHPGSAGRHRPDP